MARPIAEDFGQAFRRAYTEAGLTQSDVAEALRERGWVKVNQTYVSRWARGLVFPPIEILPVIDEVVGRPRGYLLSLLDMVDPHGLVKDEGRDDDRNPFNQLPRKRGAVKGRKPRAG